MRAFHLTNGVVILLLGICLFGVYTGIMDGAVLSRFVAMWPYLIVAWGVGFVMTGLKLNSFKFIAPVIIIAAFLSASVNFTIPFKGSAYPVKIHWENVTSGFIRVQSPAGYFAVNDTPSGDEIKLTDTLFPERLMVSYSMKDQIGTAFFYATSLRYFPRLWMLTVPTYIPISVKVEQALGVHYSKFMEGNLIGYEGNLKGTAGVISFGEKSLPKKCRLNAKGSLIIIRLPARSSVLVRNNGVYTKIMLPENFTSLSDNSFRKTGTDPELYINIDITGYAGYVKILMNN